MQKKATNPSSGFELEKKFWDHCFTNWANWLIIKMYWWRVHLLTALKWYFKFFCLLCLSENHQILTGNHQKSQNSTWKIPKSHWKSPNYAWKSPKIAKSHLEIVKPHWKRYLTPRNCQISLEIAKLAIFCPKNPSSKVIVFIELTLWTWVRSIWQALLNILELLIGWWS